MNRKVKKRLQILKKKLQQLRQQLAGAKRQAVDPQEVTSLETEIRHVQDQIEKLTSG